MCQFVSINWCEYNKIIMKHGDPQGSVPDQWFM